MQAINLFNPIHRKQSVNQNSTFKGTTYPNLRPLACDVVSFGAMKKSEFEGFDLVVVNRFKAPISKFEKRKDFDKWVEDRVNEIKNKQYVGRQDETTVQRKGMLDEWFEYVINENKAYTPSIELLILDGITKDLSEDNDTIPPVLNKGVLADTVSQIQEGIKNDKRFEQGQINFNKMYQLNLQNFYLNDLEDTESENPECKGKTGWIVIPSYDNDPENFENNVEKLKALSYKTWCTKSFNAESYLRDGDFHIYLDNGKPKLGLRFCDVYMSEIQGEKNNSKIPLDYLDIVKSHIKENKLKLDYKARKEICIAEEAKVEIKEIKKDLNEAIENKDYKTILEYFGIKVNEKENGLVSISEYHQPTEYVTFHDLGIDENEMFESICEIEGDANFADSEIKSLGNLEHIGKNADFKFSQIKDLGKLKRIEGNVSFKYSNVTDFGDLEYIGGNANFKYSKVKDLKNLKYIGGSVRFSRSLVTDLKNLGYIGGDADLNYSEVETLGKLKYIGGNLSFDYSSLKDLGDLEHVEGDANFRFAKIKDLGKLKYIGGNTAFKCSSITSLGLLEYIGGDADFSQTHIYDLGALEYIGGKADFGYSRILSLGNLKKIMGCAIFKYSKVEDLGALEYIGGGANFWLSNVKNKGNLKEIKGETFIDKTTEHLYEELVDITDYLHFYEGN